MQLNSECVRDLLLYAEENLSYKSPTISVNNLKLKDYSEEELLYTAEKLEEADYIDCIIGDGYELPIILIKSINFNGHQFLNTIRDDTIWKRTKLKASKLASLSIPVLQELATSITKSILGL